MSRLNGPRQRRRLALAAAVAAAGVLHPLAVQASAGSALFQAMPLDQAQFVLVAAPIGDGTKAQLNIYEQVRNTRPCFSLSGQGPAVVNPLLATFDFTGICGRYIDANGYSLRVGGNDLATSYRLSVRRANNDTVLVALPTKAGAGPELVVARSGGTANGFLLLVPEPGWKLMRRQFGGRTLGHVYLYRADWPQAAAAATSPAAPAAVPPVPAAGS